MSTTKKTTKKPVTEAAEKGDGTVKVKDHRALSIDKDGNAHEATLEEMAQAKAALVTVMCSDGKGGEEVKTYDCHIKCHDNGNISLAIRTSDTLEDVEIDNPKPQLGDDGSVAKDGKITLVGRGNPLGASFALVNCYRAYGAPFGQQFSHRLVRMVLDRELKTWRGLFVPAMTIAAM